MTPLNDWFEVNKAGLAKMVARKGKDRIVWELVQNAWDEDGVTTVDIILKDATNRGCSRLIVTDDAPNGFADLSHTYTMFADSKKVDDATKRGRFNLGEKLFLSICRWAEVTSTTGGFRFDEKGRTTLRRKRDSGSKIEAVVELTNAEREAALAQVSMLIPPAGIVTTINDMLLPVRTPVRSFEISLPTEIANAEDGVLTKTSRRTTVNLYDPMGDETPHIYEMGIPVVEHEGRWHIDISQKVPLNMERDNVTPRYQRELRVAVLNHTADLLTTEDAKSTWVKDAASNDKVEAAAVSTVVTKKFGEKAVRFDPSDPEANAEAVLQGFTVVHGGSMSGQEWQQINKAGVLLPAGQVTPSAKVDTSPDGRPPIDEIKWTVGMHAVAAYAKDLARDLLGIEIIVRFESNPQWYAASWGSRTLSFNLMRLGKAWFVDPDQQKVDELLIHEFAHEAVSDHLSERYHTELCRLGAKLRTSTTNLSAYLTQKVGQ